MNRKALRKQYDVMFNECVKLAESTVFDVTRDAVKFEKLASVYQSKIESDDTDNTKTDDKIYQFSELDGYTVCESKVPFIDIFSSVL